MSSYIKLDDPNVHLIGDCTTIFLIKEIAFVHVNVDFDKSSKLTDDKKKLVYEGYKLKNAGKKTHKEQVEQVQIDLMKQITMLQNAVNELDQIRRTDSIL
tara:strand:- start:147 stop:446 length:300 start_codon:yes stop_codon:yes gene_type:complete